MLMPKRVKWRKQQRGRRKGMASRGASISFGEYGLQALEPGWITNQADRSCPRGDFQIIETRWEKFGFAFFQINPLQLSQQRPVWEKAKANPEYWVAVIKPGRIMFEIEGVPRESAQRAIKLAGQKLPIKVRFVERGGHDE